MTWRQQDVDAAIEALRADRESGSGDLARRGCAAIVRGVSDPGLRDAEAVRAAVRQLAGRIVAAQPSMGPMRALAAAAVEAARGTGTAEDGREVVVRVLGGMAEFQRRLEQAGVAAAAHAAALVPAGGRVLTVSRSSTVLAALQAAGKAGPLHVVCMEGRPLLEGRRQAAALAQLGIQATLAPDAAVATLVAGCDLVLVGADALADAGVVNKIGTRAAALAAAAAGVPCYVVADSSKLLPVGVAAALEDERPAGELWADAPAGVLVWNRYFEATPSALFRGILLEDGLLTAEQLEERRRVLRTPTS